MKPVKGLLDPTFRYYSSADTDVARTFARVRREQKAAAEAAKKPANVQPITTTKRTAP